SIGRMHPLRKGSSYSILHSRSDHPRTHKSHKAYGVTEVCAAAFNSIITEKDRNMARFALRHDRRRLLLRIGEADGTTIEVHPCCTPRSSMRRTIPVLFMFTSPPHLCYDGADHRFFILSPLPRRLFLFPPLVSCCTTPNNLRRSTTPGTD